MLASKASGECLSVDSDSLFALLGTNVADRRRVSLSASWH